MYLTHLNMMFIFALMKEMIVFILGKPCFSIQIKLQNIFTVTTKV